MISESMIRVQISQKYLWKINIFKTRISVNRNKNRANLPSQLKTRNSVSAFEQLI